MKINLKIAGGYMTVSVVVLSELKVFIFMPAALPRSVKQQIVFRQMVLKLLVLKFKRRFL